jgi:Ca2+-binding EF-hand superfamily protein
MDADHNGTCDWDEFLAFVQEHGDFQDGEEEDSAKTPTVRHNMSEQDAQRVKEIFDMCDANRKGVIKLQGLMAVCTKTPQHAEFLFGKKRVKWDRIFKEMDEDGSNTISWSEFVTYISAARAARFYADETTDESFRDVVAESDPQDTVPVDDLEQRASDLVKALEDRGLSNGQRTHDSIERVVSDSDWHSIGESQDLDGDSTPAGSEWASLPAATTPGP